MDSNSRCFNFSHHREGSNPTVCTKNPELSLRAPRALLPACLDLGPSLLLSLLDSRFLLLSVLPPPLCSLSLVSLCSPRIRRQCHVQRTEGRGDHSPTELGVPPSTPLSSISTVRLPITATGRERKKARRGLDGAGLMGNAAN